MLIVIELLFIFSGFYTSWCGETRRKGGSEDGNDSRYLNENGCHSGRDLKDMIGKRVIFKLLSSIKLTCFL